MADDTTTPEPQSGITDAEAAAHIEGLLDFGDDAAPAQSADDNESPPNSYEEGEDEAPEETPVSLDEEDETDPETPVIHAPESWKAEHSAIWDKVPDDAKEIIVERDKEAKSALNRQITQTVEQRKAIEAQAAQFNQFQAQQQQALNLLISQSYPQLQKLEQTDFTKLANEDPTEWARRVAERDALRQNLQQIHQQFQQSQQVQAQQALYQRAALVEDQRARLRQEMPEFQDETKSQAIISDIKQVMSSYGFSEQELNEVYDGRVVKVLARLAQLEKQEQAKKSAQAKKQTAQAPKLLRPNAAPVRENNTNKKTQDNWNQFMKTRSTRDAAKYLEHLL